MRHVSRTISITFFVVLLFFGFVLPAYSQITVDSNFMDDTNNLFFLGNSKNQKEETGFLVLGGAYDGQDAYYVLGENCKGYDKEDRYPLRNCSGSYTNTQFSGGYLSADCQCSTKAFNGAEWESVLVGTSISAYESIQKSCPPDEHTTYTTTVSYDNGTTVCFDPLTLSETDSCPVNPQDENYLLPAGSNTAQSLCKQQDDGSRCGYENTGDGYYKPALESNCYAEQGESYTESPLEPSTDEGACVVDSGFLICTENPDNMCTGDACYDGCGTVTFQGQTNFVCYTNDTDSDGIPDYSDPDIDGDGIANDQDLDADGDGQDDVDYGNVNPGGTPSSEQITVEIDLSGVESLLSQANTKLNDANNSLDNIESDVSTIKDEIENLGRVEAKEKGSILTVDSANQDIADAQAELDALLTQISTEMDGLFSIEVPEGQFYSCFDIIKFGNNTHQTCFDRMHDELQIISYAMLFIFALIAAVILFR